MRIGSGLFVAAGLMALPGTVSAQDRESSSPLIEALSQCLAVTADAERLACLDAGARRLVDASRRREVVVVDEAEVKKTRRSLFGFSLPRIKLFGSEGPDSAEEVDEIEVAIKSAALLGNGYMSFTLADGARWTTTEPWAARTPKAGETLTIKKASMGGYFVKIAHARAVRAQRTG
ncbi:hypothetical protein [Sphingomonas baiyangensis]|uniref:Uncharacterized protein n=1 Tax=Sphingomonas baiyangensis TaxID=2572576 RepID=A0A4U1L420_9SPHN|nr:hypothetical protein [Sphingomonas baiyangensis]TKD51671.1 hypothetical protein FBR43_13580 [Sphingomonas baiyangensis]